MRQVERAPIRELEKRLKRMILLMDRLVVKFWRQRELGEFLLPLVEEYRLVCV